MDRREFFHAAGAAGALATARAHGASQNAAAARGDRDAWIGVMRRLADPVLTNLANGTLKAAHARRAGGRHRSALCHTSRGARSIAGGHRTVDRAGAGRHAPRGGPRAAYADLARRAIARAVDPASPDF